MDRKIASTVAALAAAFVFNQRAAVSDHAVESTHTVTAAAQATPLKRVPNSEEAATECAGGTECDALIPYRETGPWTASCAWFGSPKLPPRRAEVLSLVTGDREEAGDNVENWCLPTGAARPALNFLVVMVPDPLTTHLALYFDRTIEAVEAAAQQHDFFLDRYWLPWSLPGGVVPAGDTSRDLRVTQIVNAYQAAQPGLMIFTGASNEAPCERSADDARPCVMYSFLVSESPTSGINKAQFKNALHYATVLSGSARPTVHVVGPFFSGSAPSAIALTSDLKSQGPVLNFASGTMTNRTQAAALRNAGIEFKQTLHDDLRAQDFLLNFLKQRHLTVRGGNVAILQEDETRFGSTLGDTPPKVSADQGPFPGVRYIKFPRELSRLRNASADNFGAAPVAPGQAMSVAVNGLSWNWKDASKDEDSVPAFSGQQEPLSQQAVLLSISDMIRQENIKYVGIAATDIFDILFLSKFLKIEAPNTRLFVLDADVLMVRTSAEGRELDGTLAVTTYPLFARNADWTHEPGERPAGYQSSVDIFPSRIAEGVYNAVLTQLDPKDRKVQREYADPLWIGASNNRPPLWLTMVGRNGFWPVSVQENERPELQAAPTPGPSVSLSPNVRDRLTFDSPDGTTLLLEGVLVAWGVIHFLGVCRAPGKGYPWLRQFQVRASQHSHAQYQTYYLLCGTLALSTMLVLIAISIACLAWHGRIAFSHPLLFPWLFQLFYGLIGFIGMALLVRAGLISRLIVPKFVGAGFRWTPWIVYFATLGVWLGLNTRSGGDGLFFAQRALYLTDDVSPLLPIELLLLMYYAWAWTFIRKVRLSESKQVRVPDPAALGPGGQGLTNSVAELTVATDGIMFNPSMLPAMLTGFIAVVLLLLRPWEVLRSVEGAWYDFLIVVLVSLICLLIMMAWGRYLYVWGGLRRLLRGLERTPLRAAFGRFPKTYSWSQLWYEDAERRAYTISARSVECFQALVSCTGFGAAGVEQLATMVRTFERVVRSDDGKHEDHERSDAVRELQGLFAGAARDILENGLRSMWVKGGGSDSLDVVEAGRSGEISADKDKNCRLLAEEFIALRYVGLIHYESAQMKNLIVLLCVGFILALASVGSYPFLAGRQYLWTLAAVFVIFGAAIIVSFAQMNRDAILSRLNGTDPGKLDWSFFLRVVSYGALPLLALVASQFPSIGRSLFSWLQPALTALH